MKKLAFSVTAGAVALAMFVAPALAESDADLIKNAESAAPGAYEKMQAEQYSFRMLGTAKRSANDILASSTVKDLVVGSARTHSKVFLMNGRFSQWLSSGQQ